MTWMMTICLILRATVFLTHWSLEVGSTHIAVLFFLRGSHWQIIRYRFAVQYINLVHIYGLLK
jgi:hypothetical protein